MNLAHEAWWLLKVDFAGTPLGIAVSFSIVMLAFGIVVICRR